MDNFFKTPVPIETSVTISRTGIVADVVSTLNKMAESRFDGQNTSYVNNLQPEMDFDQDKNLVNGYFDEAVANVMRRIEPYVTGYETNEGNTAGTLSLRFPENWKAEMKPVLESKVNGYVKHYIIFQWLEKVSMPDVEYTAVKVSQLLRDVKGTCELRKGKVHRVWNGTY